MIVQRKTVFVRERIMSDAFGEPCHPIVPPSIHAKRLHHQTLGSNTWAQMSANPKQNITGLGVDAVVATDTRAPNGHSGNLPA